MTKPAAIAANLVDMKNVAAHRCVRLVIDVPAEQAPLVIAAFGWPTMADPVPVAIARLTGKPKQEQALQATPAPPITPIEQNKRDWGNLSAAQQAGIRCNDQAFRRFLREVHRFDPWTADDAAEAVRQLCGVTSRKHIEESPHSHARWVSLDTEFLSWLNAPVVD